MGASSLGDEASQFAHDAERASGVSAMTTLTPPPPTTPTRGVRVADKSPNHHNAKKVGKSLKEKRSDKHAKRETKKGLFGDQGPGARTTN